jgi:hypothetical protein
MRDKEKLYRVTLTAAVSMLDLETWKRMFPHADVKEVVAKNLLEWLIAREFNVVEIKGNVEYEELWPSVAARSATSSKLAAELEALPDDERAMLSEELDELLRFLVGGEAARINRADIGGQVECLGDAAVRSYMQGRNIALRDGHVVGVGYERITSAVSAPQQGQER